MHCYHNITSQEYKIQINLQKDIQNSGPAPPIGYTPDITVNNEADSKSESLNVDIKTHLGEVGSETISFYIPVFKQKSPEAWMKFKTFLQNIIKVQSLKTGSQW